MNGAFYEDQMQWVSVWYQTLFLDGHFQHSFTYIIKGPASSGKSTFVLNLLLHQKELIDVEFDYIPIVIGSDEKDNTILSILWEVYPTKVKIFEMKNLYPSDWRMKNNFQFDFEKHIMVVWFLMTKGKNYLNVTY